jgi:hypothetical protein
MARQISKGRRTFCHEELSKASAVGKFVESRRLWLYKSGPRVYLVINHSDNSRCIINHCSINTIS